MNPPSAVRADAALHGGGRSDGSLQVPHGGAAAGGGGDEGAGFLGLGEAEGDFLAVDDAPHALRHEHRCDPPVSVLPHVVAHHPFFVVTTTEIKDEGRGKTTKR